MIRAHVIELSPTREQERYFVNACGVARFAYNWGLARWKELYESSRKDPSVKRPCEGDLRKELNRIKRDEFPWMLDVTKCAPQQAIKNLGRAFRNFFNRELKAKYPKKHKKKRHNSFYVDNGHFEVHNDRREISIAKLGRVKLKEPLRYRGRVNSAVVSLRGGRWFVSISVETADVVKKRNGERYSAVAAERLERADSEVRGACGAGGENQAVGSGMPAAGESAFLSEGSVVGVDLGISHLATLSTGEKIEGPKALRKNLRKLKRLSRDVSRKKFRSVNWKRAVLRLAKFHARVANVRKDALHKLTTELAERFETICVENLNVKGMMSNKKLARCIADMGFHEFKRQLAYKVEERGGTLVVADMWYPSSKMCSACGQRVASRSEPASEVDKLSDLPLSVRKWKCPECGAFHDRDVMNRRPTNASVPTGSEQGVASVVQCDMYFVANAAENLKKLASNAASSAASASGGAGSVSSDAKSVREGRPAPMKLRNRSRGEDIPLAHPSSGLPEAVCSHDEQTAMR